MKAQCFQHVFDISRVQPQVKKSTSRLRPAAVFCRFGRRSVDVFEALKSFTAILSVDKS